MRVQLNPFLSKKLRSIPSLFCIVVGVHVAAFGAAEDPKPASETQPAASLPVGTEVVLKADIRLVERDSIRGRVGAPKRLIPGHDRLFYRIGRYCA